MNIQITLAARYLFGRPLRTFLTTLAVVFGVFVLFGMNIILPTMLQAFDANVLAAYDQVDVTISHKTGESFPLIMLDKTLAVEGVRVATGTLGRTVNLPADFLDNDPASPDAVTAIALIGLDPDTAQQVRAYQVDQGRFLEAGDSLTAVISASFANTLHLQAGDTLTLPTADGKVSLTIVGIRPTRTQPGNEEVLITLADAQRLFDQPNQINAIEANFNTTDENKRADILANLESALGKNYTLGALSTSTELFASLQLGQFIINAFGVLALVMGGFIIFNTFRTVVAERRRDIAMLRAVGASRGTVLGAILAEGLIQGVIGTAVGMVLGYLMGLVILIAIRPLMGQILHITLGPPVVSPLLIIVSVVLGLGTTTAAGLIPARNATQISPLEALRPANAEVETRAASKAAMGGAILVVLAALGLVSGNKGLALFGSVLFVLGLILTAPVLIRPIAKVFGQAIALTFAREGTGDMAQHNLNRQPTRSAVTASTIMIGLAIIVGMAGVLSSISMGFLGILKKSLGSDYLFVPPSVGVWASNIGANNALAERLRAVDGVGAISTFRFANSAVATPPSLKSEGGDAPFSLLGIDPIVFAEVADLDFFEGDAEAAYQKLAAGRAVILNGAAATTIGANVGDRILLTTLNGEETYEVVGIANDVLNAKIVTGYISQASMKTDFNKTEDVFIQLNLANGADEEAVAAQLNAIVADYPQFQLISGKAYFDQYKSLFDAAFIGYYVMFGVLALPSLIAVLNTLAISVIERTREIGMMRAVGATQQQVRRMIVAESLLLGAIGTAFGILSGLYLGYVMVQGLSLAGFPVPYQFPLGGLLAAIAIGLSFAAVAAFIPARQAAQMQIVQALRYE